MLKSFLFATLFISFSGFGQGTQTKIIVPTVNSSDSALLQLPDDYTTTTKTYPLLVFLHGNGESGNDLSRIWNSSGAGGPANLIATGKWPSSFINPKDGNQYKFIVVSPQDKGGYVDGDDADVIVSNLKTKYRIDGTRVYIIGLSLGGGGAMELISQLDPNETVTTHVRKNPVAAVVLLSGASNSPQKSWLTSVAANGVHVIALADPNNDTYGEVDLNYINFLNAITPGLGLFVANNLGHGGWSTEYVTSYMIPGTTMNLYQWLLQYQVSGTVVTPPIVTPPVVVPPVVTPPVITPPTTSTAHIIHPNGGVNFLRYKDFIAMGIKPGDTIYLQNEGWISAAFDSLIMGTSAKPVYIAPLGGQVSFHVDPTISSNGIHISNSKYVKMIGITGIFGIPYGFFVYHDMNLIYEGTAGIVLDGQDRNIDISGVYNYHVDIGFVVENNGDCGGPGSGNLGSWVMDSISIHDCKIVGTWNEGMYIGNTSPDNSATNSDKRPVTCNGVVTYPRPGRLGDIRIYNNIVDSTGRGGIQLSSASAGDSRIYSNTVTHSGLNGDDGQGAGIAIGEYTHAWIFGNKIVNTYTWGIASVGGSGTNNPIRVDSNYIDSSGYLTTFNLSQAPDTKVFYNPLTEPRFKDTLTWPQAIAVLGKNNQDHDSTRFIVIGNTIGSYKSPTMAITLEDGYNNFQKQGNATCNNLLFNGTLADVSTQVSAFPINYTLCWFATPPPVVVNVPPVANAGAAQTITLPVNSATLSGSGTDADGTVVTYAWAQVGGPSVITSWSSVSPAKTVVGKLIQGTYTFQLTVTDNQGAKGISYTTVTVNPAVTPKKVIYTSKLIDGKVFTEYSDLSYTLQ